MIIVQTPLRISFAGGGTDFKEFYRETHGMVVSTAIDKYVFVVVKERFDDKIRVSYTKTEIVDEVDEIQHDLVREALRLVGVDKGIEIVTLADISSEGSGLGSSSALTVGLLNALYAHRGISVSTEAVAREACEIEIEILGKPIGKQDQYIAAYGGLRSFTFIGNGTVETEPIKLNQAAQQNLCDSLMLFYTGVTRQSASILGEQRAMVGGNMSALKAIRQQARAAAWELATGRVEDLGHILATGWLHKKTLASGITNPQIDEMYDRAMCVGAVGGKITGAGGGGFFLVVAPPERRAAVREELAELTELPIRIGCDGSKIIFNGRR